MNQDGFNREIEWWLFNIGLPVALVATTRIIATDKSLSFTEFSALFGAAMASCAIVLRTWNKFLD